MWCQKRRGQRFGPVIVLPGYFGVCTFPAHFGVFFWSITDKGICLTVMPITPHCCVVPSSGVTVDVAKSLNRDHRKISQCCDLCGMKLKTSKTKIIIICWSRTMDP